MKNVVKVKESFKESLNKYSQPVHTYQKFTEGVGAGYQLTFIGIKLTNVKVGKTEKDGDGFDVAKFTADIVPGKYGWYADHPYWTAASSGNPEPYNFDRSDNPFASKAVITGGKVEGTCDDGGTAWRSEGSPWNEKQFIDEIESEDFIIQDSYSGGWVHSPMTDTLEWENEVRPGYEKYIDDTPSEKGNLAVIEKISFNFDPEWVADYEEALDYAENPDREDWYEEDEWDDEEEDFDESRRHPDPDKWKKGDWVIYKGKRYVTSLFMGGDMVKLESPDESIVVPQSEVYKATRKDIYNESKKHKRIMKESRAQDIKYLKYLLRKEEVTALDDEERWELQDLINKYGYPEEYDESRIKEDAYASKVRQDVLAINAAKKQINDAVDSLDRKVAEVTNDIVQSANRRPVKPEVLTEAERYSHKLVLKSDDGNGTFRIRNEKNYRYKSEEEAQEDLDRLNKKFGSMLAGKKVHLEIEEIPKKPRKKANEDETFENPFKEGDVLVGDIGYNCELPVFYKVTKVTPKCVYARRLATKFKDTDGYGQVGYLTPNVDDMRGEAIRMMVKKANHYEWEKKGTPDRYYVILPDYSRNILNLWDGQPAYYNSMD